MHGVVPPAPPMAAAPPTPMPLSWPRASSVPIGSVRLPFSGAGEKRLHCSGSLTSVDLPVSPCSTREESLNSTDSSPRNLRGSEFITAYKRQVQWTRLTAIPFAIFKHHILGGSRGGDITQNDDHAGH